MLLRAPDCTIALHNRNWTRRARVTRQSRPTRHRPNSKHRLCMSDPDIEAIVDELFTATAPASLQTSGCRFVPTHRVPAGPSSETRAGSPTTAEFRDAMSELRVYASRRRHRYANHTARLFCSHPQQRTRYHASCLLSSHACTHEGGILKQPCIPTPPSLSCRLTRRPLRSLNFFGSCRAYR